MLLWGASDAVYGVAGCSSFEISGDGITPAFDYPMEFFRRHVADECVARAESVIDVAHLNLDSVLVEWRTAHDGLRGTNAGKDVAVFDEMWRLVA